MSAPLHIPLFNSIELDLPAWFAVPTKNFGNPRKPVWFALANPMTTARNISNRKHEHSIDIKRKVIETAHLAQNSWDNHDHPIGFYSKDMTIDHFAPIDQARIEKMEQHPNATFGNYPVLSRGRPEALEKNIVYNQQHKNHSLEQRYGNAFLEKVRETLKGKPITHGEASAHPSPASSRTPSRLSSLASSLRSSVPSKSESESSSDSSSDSGSESGSESDEEKSKSSKSSKSKSSSFSIIPKQKKPSVSRGKPPLKRKEISQSKIKKSAEREAKKRAKEEAMEAKKKARQEAKEAKEKEKAEKPKKKTKTTKPTPSEAGEAIVKKSRGRTPKYATKEEAYKAKLEQNKLGKQKKAEEKKKAKEAVATSAPPKAKKTKKKLIIEEDSEKGEGLPKVKKPRGRPKKVVEPKLDN